MRRKGFHVLLALILLVCLVSSFVEFAIGWNETIFSTGYDTQTFVAVVMLLVEMVFALASFITIFLLGLRVGEPLGRRRCPHSWESGVHILPPDPYLLVPLRI